MDRETFLRIEPEGRNFLIAMARADGQRPGLVRLERADALALGRWIVQAARPEGE
jgi:hypothetical protein